MDRTDRGVSEADSGAVRRRLTVGAVALGLGGWEEAMTKKPDDFLARIEAFSDAKGGGVVIRKAVKGYSMFCEDNGKPIARLRPTGKGDEVEVLWWSHRDRWDQIGDFGPMVMALDEALDY